MKTMEHSKQNSVRLLLFLTIFGATIKTNPGEAKEVSNKLSQLPKSKSLEEWTDSGAINNLQQGDNKEPELVLSLPSVIAEKEQLETKANYEWIDWPNIEMEIGPAQRISVAISTGEGGHIRFPVNISHVFEVVKKNSSTTANSAPEDYRALLDLVRDSNFGVDFNYTKRAGKRYRGFNDQIRAQPYSRAYMTFSPFVAHFKGRARVRNLFDVVDRSNGNQQESISEQNIEVLASVELRPDGRPDGDYVLEYIGTNEYLHPEFYNLMNKDLADNNDREISNVRSPHHCGELAIKAKFNVAVYRMNRMSCMLKKVNWGHGLTYSKSGTLLGPFRIPIFSGENTIEQDAVKNWAKRNSCDIIHSDYENRHHCHNFPAADEAAVLMVRNQPEVDHLPPSAFGSHQKFYMIAYRDMPQSHDAFYVENVKSAHECGELALYHDFWLTVYRNDTKICQFKTVQLDVGTCFTREDRFLGNYNVAFYDQVHVDSSETRANWVMNRKCDMIHNSKNLPYWCKVYPTSTSSIIMYRFREKDAKQA